MKHTMIRLGTLLAGALFWEAVLASSPGALLRMPAPGEILDTGALLSHGYDGRGVRVGVISNGVSNYDALARAGILPKDVAFFGDTPGNGDEGDWMMQVVHAIAPGTKLGFCPADVHSSRQISDCARVLVEQFHADIIVDDINSMPVLWFPTPKAIADEALKRNHPNVLFFTGAGNNGGGYYQSTWTPIPLAVSGSIYQAQDFGRSVGQGSRPYDSTSIPPGRGMDIFLGSDTQPGGKPDDCAPTNPEVTLAVFDPKNKPLASKTSRCPLLELSYSNHTGATQRVRIVILLRGDSSVPGLAFKMAVIQAGETGTGPVQIRYGTGGGAGSSATEPGLSAVAAVDPNTGYQGRYLIEDFANSGPLCLDYEQSAEEDSWVHLQPPHCFRQPRFAVPDRTIVAYPSQGRPGYEMRPFVGDSSTGPMAAGAAALLLSAHVPPGRIETLFEQTARAQTETRGWNARYGYGLIDVDAAAVAAGVLPRIPDKPFRASSAAPAIFHPSPAFLRDRQLMMRAKQGDGQSLETLEAAARLGDSSAQTWLAVYEHSAGDDNAAARWCWAAAQQGLPPAESFMGNLFFKGWGVPQDQRAAHAWWLRAARTGMAGALYYLGLTEAESRGAATNLVNGYALMLAAKQRGRTSPAGRFTMEMIRSHLNQDDLAKAKTLASRYGANPATIE